MKKEMIALAIMAAAVTGCGGGAGGTAPAPNTPNSAQNTTQITGVAATGRWMASGTPVVAIDRTGKSVSGFVDAAGQYAITWSGLSFPILLKATESGIPLYSIVVNNTEAAGKVNINQLTHLAVVGLLGDGTPADIENRFKTDASKLTTELLKESALSAMSQLPESVLMKTGLTRSSLRDVRTQANFQIGVREDKLLDQLVPTVSGGKVTLTGLATLPAFSDAVVSNSSNFPPLSGFSWCSRTSDNVVYTTKDIVVYGVNVSSDEKLLAARASQRALDEIKTQLDITAPGSGIGIDGTNKIAVCVDGTHEKDAQGSLKEINTASLDKTVNSGGSVGEWVQVLKHEMVHTVAAGLLNIPHQNVVLPLWFTEGMATYLADQEMLDTVDNMNVWSQEIKVDPTQPACIPTTVTYYGATTNCPIMDFGNMYRGYGAIFAALFDAPSYGGGGNALTKLKDLHIALQKSSGLWADGTAQAAFAQAFDALALTAPSGEAVTLAAIQTDAGWKNLVTPYFEHNTVTFTVNGANDLRVMALTFADDFNRSVGSTDAIVNNAGRLSIRHASGSLSFFVVNGGAAYQSPAPFQWTPGVSTTFTFGNTWKAVSFN